MKQISLILLFLFVGFSVQAQSAVGIWKTIDDETGAEKSHVEIYEKENGTLEGKVIKILTEGREDAVCDKCKGDLKNTPIQGLVILRGLKSNGERAWKDGKILDPENGKEYKSKMELKDENTLEVRGFIGISLIGRTQTWYRVGN